MPLPTPNRLHPARLMTSIMQTTIGLALSRMLPPILVPVVSSFQPSLFPCLASLESLASSTVLVTVVHFLDFATCDAADDRTAHSSHCVGHRFAFLHSAAGHASHQGTDDNS